MKIHTKHFTYQKQNGFESLFAFSLSFSKAWGMIGLDIAKHSANLILWRPKGTWDKTMRKVVVK